MISIAPLIQYGFFALLLAGAVFLVGRMFVNSHRRKVAERHAKIRDEQMEVERDKPRTRDELADRVRRGDF